MRSIKTAIVGALGSMLITMSVTAQAAKTTDVDLQEAFIFQEGPSANDSFVSFTLRPKWLNKSPDNVTIHYKVYFYDKEGTELYVDSRFKDLDAKTASIAPQVLATFRGRPNEAFDYKAVASVTIRYRVDKDLAERSVSKVRISQGR